MIHYLPCNKLYIPLLTLVVLLTVSSAKGQEKEQVEFCLARNRGKAREGKIILSELNGFG